MTDTFVKSFAQALEKSYPQAQNHKNTYARNYMLRCIVDQAHWPMNTKRNDEAAKTAAVGEMLNESTATESTTSGKITQKAGSKTIGSQHWDETKVNQLIDYAERDAYEADCHQNFLKELIQVFETVTGDKYTPKAQRTPSSKRDPKAWLATRNKAA